MKAFKPATWQGVPTNKTSWSRFTRSIISQKVLSKRLSEYFAPCNLESSTTLSTQHACYINVVSGTGSTGYGGRSVRAPATNGGGCATWLAIETGDEAVTLAVRCYGYTTSSHTEGGEIIGIPF